MQRKTIVKESSSRQTSGSTAAMQLVLLRTPEPTSFLLPPATTPLGTSASAAPVTSVSVSVTPPTPTPLRRQPSAPIPIPTPLADAKQSGSSRKTLHGGMPKQHSNLLATSQEKGVIPAGGVFEMEMDDLSPPPYTL